MNSSCLPSRSAACALSACISLGLIHNTLEAQTRSALEPVVVTATRIEARVDDAIAEVSVVSRSELERSAGLSLSQILSQTPGIQSSALGGLGQPGALFIRGMESRHTLLLVDGIRLGFVDSGQPTLNNLPLGALDRIEVVRGPLSALYGADAAAGVIQLFTQSAAPGLRSQASLTAGSYTHRQADAAVSWKTDRFDVSAHVSSLAQRGISATNANNRTSTGYCADTSCASFISKPVHDPDADGIRQHSGLLKLGTQLSAHWRADLLALESIAHVDFDDGLDVDARLRLKTAVQRLLVSGQPRPGLKTRISLGESRDEYLTLASFFLRGPSQPTGAASAPLVNRQRQFGIEQQIETALGTAGVIIERLDQHVGLPAEFPAYAKTQRTVDGLGLSFDGQWQTLSWQGAVRRDRNSDWGHQTTGTLGASAALSPDWRIGGSLGSSFVMPSFQLLYYPGYSNPALQPETGRHAEVFAQWRPTPAHTVRLAWVDHRMRDLIVSPAPDYLPVNVAQARIDGFTLQWRARWDRLTTQFNVDHLEPRDSQTGLQLARRAQSAIRLSAKAPVQDWTIGGQLTAWSHRFNDAGNLDRLPGFATLDLRAERALSPEWTLALRVDNLADRIYETARGYNQPRRGAYLTLGWTSR